jgi:hypothetical protein
MRLKRRQENGAYEKRVLETALYSVRKYNE